MREEKTFKLGQLRIDGDLITFESAAPLAFEAERRDQLSVGVHYRYREASEDEETVRIRVTAHLDGQPPLVEEAVITDHPVVNDSRIGFLRVPIRASAGDHRGRFVIEARYGAGPWRKPAEIEVEERAEGTFTLHVK